MEGACYVARSTTQGAGLDGDMLYVADTKNHAIRHVDLANQNVKTVAGTGDQSKWAAPF